jgi:hypothetical protein
MAIVLIIPCDILTRSGNISQEGWRQLGYMALGAAFGVASWSPLLQHYKGNITWGQAAGLYAVNAVAFVAGAGVGGAVTSGAGTIAGATIGGATSGAISGGGGYLVSHTQGGTFYGNGNDLWRATWTGSVSGAAGGMANGLLGGGSVGAFGGGLTSTAMGSYLTSGEVDWNGALINGGISLGMYMTSTTANWAFSNENLSLGGYFLRQELVALSHSWQLEASWYEMQNGSIKGVRFGAPFGSGVNPAPKPIGNIAYEAHTHVRFGTGNEYFGPTDMSKIPIDAQTSGHGYKVYGWKNVYTLSNAEAKAMPMSLNGADYSRNYAKPNAAFNNNYAYPNGLPSMACPLGFSYYSYYYIHK